MARKCRLTLSLLLTNVKCNTWPAASRRDDQLEFMKHMADVPELASPAVAEFFSLDRMIKLTTLFRTLALLVAVLLTYRTVVFAGWPFGPALSVALASLALMCVWFSVRGTHDTDRVILLWSVVTGAIVGFLGLLVGVVASMFLWPKSNLAPILGFFVTGPYSFVGGAVLGVVFGVIASRRNRNLSVRWRRRSPPYNFRTQNENARAK